MKRSGWAIGVGVLALAASMAAGAQAPASGTGVAPPSASSLLRPALETVQGTLNTLRTDRWKRGSIRDEAAEDANSILVDMQTNLPPLMKDADATPGVLSKMVPVVRHVDAVYDVLLRVVEAARMAAPDDQTNALRQALATLNQARLSYYDAMTATATAQEKQAIELRAKTERLASYKCPAPPPAEPCKTPTKRNSTKKPSATTPQKPAATQKPQ